MEIFVLILCFSFLAAGFGLLHYGILSYQGQEWADGYSHLDDHEKREVLKLYGIEEK